MTLRNCTVEITTNYEPEDENDSYNQKKVDVIIISIPLPGGKAQYTIKLPAEVRSSLETAVKLQGNQ